MMTSDISSPRQASAPAAPESVTLPHWHDPDFLGAVVLGQPLPYELRITSINAAMASVVDAVLGLRGYTLVREQSDRLTVHARTLVPSQPIPPAP